MLQPFKTIRDTDTTYNSRNAVHNFQKREKDFNFRHKT